MVRTRDKYLPPAEEMLVEVIVTAIHANLKIVYSLIKSLQRFGAAGYKLPGVDGLVSGLHMVSKELNNLDTPQGGNDIDK